MCSAFPYRSCVIVCEVKNGWSNLSFRGVCTWCLEWHGQFSGRLFSAVITDSKTHYGGEVGSMWSLSTRAYDHLSIKDCLKLPAAVSLPKSSCLMGSVPA